MTNIDDPLISPAEAARVIGVNKSTLSRQIKAGAVRSHGGKVRLSEVLADRAANIDLTRSRRRDGIIDQFEASSPGLTADGSAPVTACVASPDATLDATADATIGSDGEDADATVMIDGVPVCRATTPNATPATRPRRDRRPNGWPAGTAAVPGWIGDRQALLGN